MKRHFNDYIQAARSAIDQSAATVSPFFDGAQTRPRLSAGQKLQGFSMLMQTFNGDVAMLGRFMDEHMGEGSGEAYLKEMGKLQKKLGGG